MFALLTYLLTVIAYEVRHVQQQTVGQHDYSLIYSFKLKSAFDACQRFSCLWRNDTSHSKCLKKWIGSALLWTRQRSTHYTDPEGHNYAQRHRQIDRHAKSRSYYMTRLYHTRAAKKPETP